MNQKGTKMGSKIHPKLAKGAKGQPQGRQNGTKNRKKGMPKIRPNNDAVQGSEGEGQK